MEQDLDLPEDDQLLYCSDGKAGVFHPYDIPEKYLCRLCGKLPSEHQEV